MEHLNYGNLVADDPGSPVSQTGRGWSIRMIHGAWIPDPTNGQAVSSTWTFWDNILRYFHDKD